MKIIGGYERVGDSLAGWMVAGGAVDLVVCMCVCVCGLCECGA